MEPAFTLILEFSAPVTVKKYISAVHMLLGLWDLLHANSYQLGKRAFVLSGNGKYEICTKV